MIYTHTCENCNTTFERSRKVQRFCSLSCSSQYKARICEGKYPNTFSIKRCKTCGKKFQPTNPCNLYCSKECKGKNNYYLKNYGITELEKNELKRKQNNKCAICGEEGFILNTTHSNEKLCVDHDHKTGKVRGLLCHNCNRALGLLKDNVEVLQRAIDYLKENI